MSDRILSERQARDWSQTELARRAGVTRQLVSAVEAGRHVPGVTAALALAQALGTSVEQLFGRPGPDSAVDVLGAVQAVGTAVGVGRVGDRFVSAPRTFGADGPEGWGVADAVVTDTGFEWLPGPGPA
ncbi:MAG: XRE family transcriptional regulator, partial [Actinomycetales bacterium]